MENIDEKIEQLTPEQYLLYEDTLKQFENSKRHCKLYSGDYVNPDFNKMKEEVYIQFFANK